MRFNPFSKRAKTCRTFLAGLSPHSWQTAKIKTTLLPRASKERSSLKLKFQDGKEMELDTESLSVKDIMEEVERHSRVLSRKAELAG